MTTRIGVLRRPAPGADHRAPSPTRPLGFLIAAAGLAAVGVAWIANLAAADTADGAVLAWAFGLNTLGFATLKLGIGVVLIGILVRLWKRVDAVKAALPHLKTKGDGDVLPGSVTTAYGAASVTATAPGPLPIHRMAKTMWAPMLAMGYMIVAAGFVVSLVWAANVAGDSAIGLAAWTRGLGFLGEGLLLAGIAFLLGSILASLREGGGEVQESLGLGVHTLRMPKTAKAFVALMMLGLMISVGQFLVYLGAATLDDVQTAASWEAWLGPAREFGLGALLAGIVLALVTIGNVLGFQYDRIKEIVRTGR